MAAVLGTTVLSLKYDLQCTSWHAAHNFIFIFRATLDIFILQQEIPRVCRGVEILSRRY